MATKSLVRITELEGLSCQALGIRSVIYGLEGCQDFSDAEIRTLEAIGREAPAGAEFYHPMGEATTNRLTGLGIAGQGLLIFTQLVQYYASKHHKRRAH